MRLAEDADCAAVDGGTSRFFAARIVLAGDTHNRITTIATVSQRALRAAVPLGTLRREL
jgi:hypothetical protein